MREIAGKTSQTDLYGSGGGTSRRIVGSGGAPSDERRALEVEEVGTSRRTVGSGSAPSDERKVFALINKYLPDVNGYYGNPPKATSISRSGTVGSGSVAPSDEGTAFEAAWKISEIINPDGSMTVRRMVISPSGSKVVRQDDYDNGYALPSIYKQDRRDNTTSSSTETPVTTPSRQQNHHRHVTWMEEEENGSKESSTSLLGGTPNHILDDNASTDVSYLTTSEFGPGVDEEVKSPIEQHTNKKHEPNHGSLFLDQRGVGQEYQPRPINPMSAEMSKRKEQVYSTSSPRGHHVSGQRATDQEVFDPYQSSGLKSADLSPRLRHHNMLFDVGKNEVEVESRQSPPSSEDELSSHHHKSYSYPSMRKSLRGLRTISSGDILQSKCRVSSKSDNIHPLHVNNASKGKNLTTTDKANRTSIFTVTVVKDKPDAKIGIKVGVKYFTCGARLVVTNVTPDGPFTNTPVECGDVVLSINGKDCCKDPKTSDVSDIVRRARDCVTIMIQKRSSDEDFHSVDDVSDVSRKYAISKRLMEADRQQDAGVDDVPSQDRKDRIQIGMIEMGGSITNKSTKRMFLNSDGSISIVTDRLHHSKNPVVSRESFNVSGDVILSVKKKSREQKVGITIMERKVFDSTSLVVSNISTDSLFVGSPLSVGDTILVVNDQDFRDNSSAHDAIRAIKTAMGELTICVRKSSEGLQNFLKTPRKALVDERKEPVKVKQQLRTGSEVNLRSSKELEFDDISYDGSIGSYHGSRSVSLRKSYPGEDLGIELVESRYGTAAVLVIAKIFPRPYSGSNRLQPGDVILSINGMSFQEQPDAQLAEKELRDARSEVRIEYQRLRVKIQSAPVVEKKSGRNKVKTVDSTTEEESPSDLSIDSVGDARSVDVSALGSYLGGISRDVRSFSDEDDLDVKDDEPRSVASSQSTPSQITMSVLRRPTVQFITVSKSSPDQEVGLAMKVVHGALRVTEVSPTGLLAGKPILPGDTVAAINGKSFIANPDAQEAAKIVSNALTVINFEIKATEKYNKPRRRIKFNKLCCAKRTNPKSSGKQTKQNTQDNLVRVIGCPKRIHPESKS